MLKRLVIETGKVFWSTTFDCAGIFGIAEKEFFDVA